MVVCVGSCVGACVSPSIVCVVLHQYVLYKWDIGYSPVGSFVACDIHYEHLRVDVHHLNSLAVNEARSLQALISDAISHISATSM